MRPVDFAFSALAVIAWGLVAIEWWLRRSRVFRHVRQPARHAREPFGPIRVGIVRRHELEVDGPVVPWFIAAARSVPATRPMPLQREHVDGRRER